MVTSTLSSKTQENVWVVKENEPVHSEIAGKRFLRVALAIHETLPLFHLKKDVRNMLKKRLGLASGGDLEQIRFLTAQFGPTYTSHSETSVQFGDKGTHDRMLTWLIVYLNGVSDEEREDWAKGRKGTPVQKIIGKLAKENLLTYLPVVCLEKFATELNLQEQTCGNPSTRNHYYRKLVTN